MNNGAFGENFPYSNFHDLNMDWIIKITKDFLDQYTHIQEVIAEGEQSLQNLTSTGLQQLQTKADALEALLQEWYDTHSSDIANQLADALTDLNNYLNTHISESTTKFNQMIADAFSTFPSNYSEVMQLTSRMNSDLYNSSIRPWYAGSIAFNTGEETSNTNNCITTHLYNLSRIITPDNYPIAIFVYRNEKYLGVLFNGQIVNPTDEITPYLTYGTFDVSGYSADYSFRLMRHGNNEYNWWNDNSTFIQKRYESEINGITPDQKYLTNKAFTDESIKLLPTNNPSAITINIGETGYNRYFYYLYTPKILNPYLSQGETAVALLEIHTINYKIDMKEIKILGPSGEDYTGTASLIYDIQTGNPAYNTSGHRYLFAIEFTKPNNTDEYWGITFQCKNEVALTKQATITPVQAFLSLKKYSDFLSKTQYHMYTEETITVGTGKQYSSLRTALEYVATIASKTHHVTVEYYGNGNTYNVMNDITSADLAVDSAFIGLTVPAYCKLVGMGSREQNKIELTLPADTPDESMFRISTINLLENAELHNLWLYGKRCRYTCHDDMMERNPEWDMKTISNCRFTSDYTHEHRAYGAGYKSGVHWKFINCIFENLESHDFGNAAFSAHNNNAMEKPASIEFVNCQAHGGSAFNLDSLNRTDGQSYPNAITQVSFYGCKATSDIWDRPINSPIQSETASLEVSYTGYGNNFDNDGVAVYFDGHYYNNRFTDQLTLWGKID